MSKRGFEIRTGTYIGRTGYEGVWWQVWEDGEWLRARGMAASPGEATRAAEAVLERLKREAR